MKKQLPLLLLFTLLTLGALLSNSCKKVNENTVEVMLSTGQWQLASVLQYNYIGSTNTSVDTLNTTCTQDQYFTFSNSAHTCTFQNFNCITQTATGKWALSEDKVILYSDIKCRDTTSSGISTPFTYAQIVSLGQYSLVMQTGDISSNYQATQVRHIKRYGFVHR